MRRFDYLLNVDILKKLQTLRIQKRDVRKRNFREMVAKDKKYKTEKILMEKKWLFYLKTIIIISKRKSTEKELSENKLDNTKTNKRICKSNSSQSKTILNEE